MLIVAWWLPELKATNCLGATANPPIKTDRQGLSSPGISQK